MKFPSVCFLVGVSVSALFVGCADKPTGLTPEELATFEGGGNAGANGTAQNPSGTTDSITTEEVATAATTTQSTNSQLETTIYTTTDQNVTTQDFGSLNTSYKEAIATDPNNTEAQFGAAVTELIMVNQIPEVSDFYDSLMVSDSGLFKVRGVPLTPNAKRLSESGQWLLKLSNAQATDLPKISALQAAITDSVLPRITYALDRLSIIENDPDFTFMITPKMQGDSTADTIEIDRGEAYAIDASLRILRGFLLTIVSYNVDVDINGSYDWFREAIDSSDAGNDSLLFVNMKRLHETPSFLALHPDGDLSMKSAISNWRASIEKIRKGIDAIDAETDDQVNDLIKIEILDSINSELAGQDDININSLTQALDTVSAFLNGPYTVRFDNTTCTGEPVIIDSIRAKTQTCETTFVNLKINLSAIFDNPIADLKTKLPYFKWKPASEWREMGTDTVYIGEGEGDFNYECSYDQTRQNYSCGYVAAPDSGSYGFEELWNPIELTTASGAVISDSLLDESGPDFPDYTFGGLFPEMTAKSDWEELMGSNDSDSGTTATPIRNSKVLGFTLARNLR